MKNKAKTLWCVAGIIWLVALGLSFWNHTIIEEVVLVREKIERYDKEVTFQRRNLKKLNWVLAYEKSQLLPVESIKLGVIKIRNHLTALAHVHKLHDLDINTQSGQAEDGKIPVTLKARGSMPDAMGFMSVLNGYTFLPAKGVRVTVFSGAGEVELEFKLVFQYSIPNQNDDESEYLHTALETDISRRTS